MKHARRYLAFFVFVLVLSLGALILSADGPSKKFTPLTLGAVDKTEFSKIVRVQGFGVTTMSLLRDLVSRPPSGDYYLIHVEFDSQASRERFNVPNVAVVNGYKQFADVFIPSAGKGWDENAEEAITKAPGYLYHDFPQRAYAPHPTTGVETPHTRALPEEIIRGGLANYTGKNVIIAVVDSGLDFRHPDFITYDAAGRPTSRLLFFWDTTSSSSESGVGLPGPFKFPNGKAIGTVYTKAQLTDDLRSANHPIGATDVNGHGTAATGVATGNGNASKSKYVGVAPQADIIAVRIGGSDSEGLENEYLLTTIVAWLDKIAAERKEPLVVSCSFGGHSGGHDGNSVEERQLAVRFADDTRGRALLVAAGNEEDSGIHARVNVTGSGKPGALAWASKDGALVTIYIRSTSGTSSAAGKLGIDPLKTSDGRELPMPECWEDKPNPFSGDASIFCSSKGGWAALKLATDAPGEFVADAYVANGEFHQSLQRPSELTGTPAGASTAITVGSYDWNDQVFKKGVLTTTSQVCDDKPMVIGDVSCYSNAGLSRSGIVKPDIVAPGEYFYAPYAKLPNGGGVNPKHYRMLDPTEQYTAFNGTSAATPYAAGVVALLMQKKPTISVGEVKSLLRHNATSDTYTGKVPNPRWGYGKLDLAAARAMLTAVR